VKLKISFLLPDDMPGQLNHALHKLANKKKPITPRYLRIHGQRFGYAVVVSKENKTDKKPRDKRKARKALRHPSGYAMLISQVRTELVAAGFDPSIGFAHCRSWNPIPLVYDLMELLRPVVDRRVLEFALSRSFKSGDFTINSKGGCRLNPQMAKVIASQVATLQVGPVVRRTLNYP
jgi:hypothetical protein